MKSSCRSIAPGGVGPTGSKNSELPLFPGYLFCRFDVRDRLLPILTTPGVIGIVGAGKTPVPVDDEEIEAIRAILRSGLAVQPLAVPPASAPRCTSRAALWQEWKASSPTWTRSIAS